MKCFVPSCKNRSDHRNWKTRINYVKVSFHRFPRDPDTRSLWLDILGIRVSEIPETASVCSMHFEETSFYTKGSYGRLKYNALPRKTLNEEETSHSDMCENNVDTRLSPNTTEGLIPKTEEVQSIADTEKLFDDCPLSPELSTSNKEDKGTMMSPKFVYNSPERVRLRERLKYVEADSRKKLCALRQQLRRKENQVIHLKNIIEDLKRQRC
ncbi:uncharacterized protein LOC143217208 [Lasioglossum baleicum]|uniref:uncharacterized protein LOC143217208 n=1 Tax=Lasioglossum baleicum TaxID=434251 RepID=UPI003FCD1C1B